SIASFLQINDRRIAAEKALAEAKLRTEEAEDARRLAEISAAIAQENEEKALSALQAKQAAEKAAEQAKVEAAHAAVQSLQARKETERALAARQSQEEKFRQQEKMLRQQIEDLNQQRPAEAAAPDEPSPEISEPKLEEARAALTRAASTYSREFSPFDLQRAQRNPDGVIAGLSRCMDDVSRALMVNPGYAPALMLKGRLHLVFREWDQALSSFQRAKAGIQSRPDSAFGENPDQLLGLIEPLQHASGNSGKNPTQVLVDSPLHDDRVTASLIEFLRKNAGSRAAPSAPVERKVTPGEVALRLVEINPGKSPDVEFYTNELGLAAMRIRNGSAIHDLSPLQVLDLAELDLQGLGRTDWETIYALHPERLTLRECQSGASPAISGRGVAMLKELRVENSGLTSLEFLRAATQLERLFLNHTQVKDFSPLSSRRLRTLEMDGLMPVSLFSLQSLPLETLVIGRELAEDSGRIRPLRYHRTLKYIRVPDDPEWQTAPEFWQKVDAGAYTKQ
ncbi:MAG TPA: leucine-rich repeat domain-containing protein, partial [Chthoniobacterales bacterium]